MVLSARGLSLQRHGRWLLHPVDLALERGTVTAVLGPNGAGKSTLLQLLAGLETPDGGHLDLDGRPLHSLSEPQLARSLAVMTQEQPLAFPFSVEEVVRLGTYPLSLARDAEQVHSRNWLQRLDLEALAPRNYLRLSGGERQRVQLARVMAQCGEPTRVLLLDEPISAMDLKHQHLCLRQVRALAGSGIAVLLILHDLALAARYADRALLLKNGRLLAAGSVAEVMTGPRLSELFDVCVEVDLDGDMPRFSSFVRDDGLQP